MNISLRAFLDGFKQDNFFDQYRIVWFQGNVTYPLLFFSTLCTQLKNQSSVLVKNIDLNSQDFLSIQASLETTFLGNGVMYWLGAIEQLDKAKQKCLFDYLATYTGPNNIAFFIGRDISPPLSDTSLRIEVPERMDADLFRIFFMRCGHTITPRMYQFITMLFERYNYVPLDAAPLLMHYARVLRAHIALFFDTWLDSIIMPETSLFALSQHFFAKNNHAFFDQWCDIREVYALPFWTSFWSEQLWRASFFIHLLANNQHAAAKRIGFRLPFSFLQRDWKKYHSDELAQAHQYICALDHHIKNGGSSMGLDLFYSKFLFNQFS